MLERDHPLCLLPLGPRSIVQHAVELAVRQVATVVDVVASEGAHQLRSLLGDGSRWGISLRLHLVADADRPYSSLRFLCRSHSDASDGRCLMIHAQCLAPGAGMLTEIAAASSSSTVLCHAQNGTWSGLACVPFTFEESLALD